MQGSFEKRVQEKLDELRLTPSEPVWKNIEKELKPEKRRRFPFWIPFIVVMLGGAAWWMLESKDAETANDATFNTSAPGLTIEEKNVEAKSGQVAGRKTVETKPASSSSDKNSAIANSQASNKISTFEQSLDLELGRSGQTVNRSSVAKSKLKNTASDLNGRGYTVKDKSFHQDIIRSMLLTERAPKRVETIPHPSIEDSIDTIPQQATDQPASNTTASADSVVKKIESKEVLPLERTDTVAAKTKVAAAKKEWQKTVTVKGGWSQFSDGILGSSQRLADLSSSPNPGYYNGSVGSSNPVRRGAAFQVGAGLSKAIHPRWDLAVGVQYAYYSTHTKVGEFKAIDTAVFAPSGNVSLAGYYRNTNLQDYTIRYGILELPVSIAFRPLARLPLSLSVGASYGRLLHSNALQFDRWANIYYTDKDASKKNLFAGFASLQYTILNKGAWRLQAGPMVQYHFSGLQKNSADQKLFFAGLQTAISF
ncbi:MAG TPA: TonB-dependent receptor [Flavisolibacter sp.]|jgi:hypothetical protein|nr:TonB-dependent receptor [Flavisolibacter sp.]